MSDGRPKSCPSTIEVQLDDVARYLHAAQPERQWALERTREHERRRSVTPYVYPSIDRAIIRLEWEDGRQPFLVELDLRERTVTEFYD